MLLFKQLCRGGVSPKYIDKQTLKQRQKLNSECANIRAIAVQLLQPVEEEPRSQRVTQPKDRQEESLLMHTIFVSTQFKPWKQTNKDDVFVCTDPEENIGDVVNSGRRLGYTITSSPGLAAELLRSIGIDVDELRMSASRTYFAVAMARECSDPDMMRRYLMSETGARCQGYMVATSSRSVSGKVFIQLVSALEAEDPEGP